MIRLSELEPSGLSSARMRWDYSIGLNSLMAITPSNKPLLAMMLTFLCVDDTAVQCMDTGMHAGICSCWLQHAAQ